MIQIRWPLKFHIDRNDPAAGLKPSAVCANPRARRWVEEIPAHLYEERFDKLVCRKCVDRYRAERESEETY